MSDFTSPGWSWFVAAAVVASLLACLGVLAVASRGKVIPGDGSTGHVWDEDLRELNNPLPRWWMGLFVITVVFAGVYLALYPGLGSLAGLLHWSSAGQHQAEVLSQARAIAPVYARYAAMPVPALARDSAAMAIGDRLFANNCAQCHGADARGSPGFPNLTDGDWLWGGTPEQIEQTITEGRNGVMPVMAPAVGSAQDIRDLANYVLSLSGSPHDAAAAQRGQPKFAVCAGCHGADGRGNTAVGAPNLTDSIWLYAPGEAAIVTRIEQGANLVMPAQGGRLTPPQIHVLAAYVWGLSHPQGEAAASPVAPAATAAPAAGPRASR